MGLATALVIRLRLGRLLRGLACRTRLGSAHTAWRAPADLWPASLPVVERFCQNSKVGCCPSKLPLAAVRHVGSSVSCRGSVGDGSTVRTWSPRDRERRPNPLRIGPRVRRA